MGLVVFSLLMAVMVLAFVTGETTRLVLRKLRRFLPRQAPAKQEAEAPAPAVEPVASGAN